MRHVIRRAGSGAACLKHGCGTTIPIAGVIEAAGSVEPAEFLVQALFGAVRPHDEGRSTS